MRRDKGDAGAGRRGLGGGAGERRVGDGRAGERRRRDRCAGEGRGHGAMADPVDDPTGGQATHRAAGRVAARRAGAALLLAVLFHGAAAPAPTAAGAAPPLACPSGRPTESSFRIDYAVRASRGPLALDGDSEFLYVRTGGAYVLRSDTRSLLYRGMQESRGAVGARGLLPESYVERSTGRRDRTVTFDRSAQTATYSALEETRALTPQAQDRASLLLALGEAMQAPVAPRAVPVVVAGARGEAQYRFAVHERGELDLPYGRVEAVRLQRDSADDTEHFEVWLAPGLCWLPVQIRYRDERGQQVINRMRTLTAAASGDLVRP